MGQELLRQGLVEERHLTQAYALQQQSMYVRAQPDLVLLELMDRMPFAAADRFAALPLVESEKGWIVAVDDDLSCAERDELAFLLGEPTFFLFSSTADLLEAFEGALAFDNAAEAPQPAGVATLLEETSVELPQAGMALAYALHLGRSVSMAHTIPFRRPNAPKRSYRLPCSILNVTAADDADSSLRTAR